MCLTWENVDILFKKMLFCIIGGGKMATEVKLMCTFSLIQNEANSHVTVSVLSFCRILITRMVGILLQREHSVSLVRKTPRLCRAGLLWWHACIVEDLFCLSVSQCESVGHSVKQQSWMSHCAQDTVGLPNSIWADRTDSPTKWRLLTFQLSKIN